MRSEHTRRRPPSRGVSVTALQERTWQRPQQPAPPDLDHIMKRVAAGDQSAFATLYDAIAPRAYGLIRRITRDPALAEEVTQDALVEVWRTASRFDPERGSAVGWILSIAHHRAVDRIRAEQAAADRERRVRRGDRGSHRPAGARGRTPLPASPHRHPAGGDPARVLRRPHLPRG